MTGLPEIQYHPEASDEVDAALVWYLRRSPAAAAAFLVEVEHAAARIKESPLRWPRIDKRLRRYILPSFPFTVIYRVRPHEIEIIAFAHQSRRPGYWRVRVRRGLS